MAASFTATLGSPAWNNGNVRVQVTYSDGTNSVVDTYNMGDLSGLDQTVVNRIAQLNQLNSDMSALTPGVFTPPPTPIASAPVVQAPSPQQQFLSAWRTLDGMNRAISAGLMANTDAAYMDALASAKALFDPSYVTMI